MNFWTVMLIVILVLLGALLMLKPLASTKEENDE